MWLNDSIPRAGRTAPRTSAALYEEGPEAVALLYPNFSRDELAQVPGTTASCTSVRAGGASCLPSDDVEAHRLTRVPLFTYEAKRPVGDYPVVAVSVAYEPRSQGYPGAREK